MKNKTGWEIAWTHGVDIDTEDDWALVEILVRLTASDDQADRA